MDEELRQCRYCKHYCNGMCMLFSHQVTELVDMALEVIPIDNTKSFPDKYIDNIEFYTRNHGGKHLGSDFTAVLRQNFESYQIDVNRDSWSHFIKALLTELSHLHLGVSVNEDFYCKAWE